MVRTGAESAARSTKATQSSSDLTELAARLRLAITRTARRLRQEAGVDLSPSQTAALATVERHGPLTPSELAAAESIQRPTATRIVARLDEAGLVERTADPADRRSFVISATPRGQALMKKLRGRKNAFLARRLRGLGAEDMAALAHAAEILERLLEGERR
jgi:DNA-binding MarR family transcriptional regulator